MFLIFRKFDGLTHKLRKNVSDLFLILSLYGLTQKLRQNVPGLFLFLYCDSLTQKNCQNVSGFFVIFNGKNLRKNLRKSVYILFHIV